jgi:hypothetical protein
MGIQVRVKSKVTGLLTFNGNVSTAKGRREKNTTNFNIT